MFSKSAVLSLAQALCKRAAANEVDWAKEGARFFVELPDLLLSLSRKGELEDPEPEIVFEVDTPEGTRIGILQVKARDPGYSDLKQLLDYAEGYSADWDERIMAVARLIERGSGRIGGAVVEAPISRLASPPPPPPRPTELQALAFFEKLAGKWELKFEKRLGSFGTEVLEIDENGNYFTITHQLGGKDIARTIRPTYRLVLVSCDPGLEHVEVSKEELNGKVRQIEVLAVFPNSMEGYAKHDEHKLVYTRR